MKIKYFQVGEFRFTLKQMQTISKLRDGFAHKEIADQFGISQGTVDHNVSYLFHKARLKNSRELVALCTENGLHRNGIFNGVDLFKKQKRSPKR